MSELQASAMACAADAPPKDSIVEAICTKFQQRSAVGWKKYGTTLDRGDLGILDWIQHAQEELMDGILYLEKLKKVVSATAAGAVAAAGAAESAAAATSASGSSSS
jgi:hypothetical protein